MQADQTLPRFPYRALPSKAVFYRPLQDIDIYVEDEDSEVFYAELLKRLIADSARIDTVFPLRGRRNVEKTAKEYSGSRPALFLIDGDLNWVTGLDIPSTPNIYVHPCYCVENYLFCERAMVQVCVENSGHLTEEDAQARLNWDRLCDRLTKHLVPLFIEFALAFSLCPEIKTVSRGIGCILRNARRGSPPTIDTDKVAAVRQEVQNEILKQIDKDIYESTRTAIENHLSVLEDPLDIVSGKDFLLPVQMFEANRVGEQKVRRRSFVFRLARHCDLHKLNDLRQRILHTIESNKVTGSTEDHHTSRL